MRNNSKGLTLIELLITIAVIAIVAAISVPIVNNVIFSAKQQSDKNQAVIIIKFIEKWDSAGGTLLQTDNVLNAYFESELTEKLKVPDGYLLTGAGTDSDPYILIAAPTSPASSEPITDTSGTFDDGEGTTYTRDETGITINTVSANWENMSVQYNLNGTTTTNAITKKMSNGTIVGIITKVSNTEIRISTSGSSDFVFSIVYNGGSTGSFSFA
jgi:prepilin-type N-terminal cleavage/methylation domain-containing protein